MTEHEKRIREALEAGPQAWNYDSNMRPFYNDPEGNSRGGECDGTYALFGADFEIDGEVYEGPTLSERCKEADAKFIAACDPSAIRALLADLDAMRGALDHIRKSCQASRSQTRRVRWIEARAYGALIGDHELHRTIDLPKDGGPDTTEKLKRKLAHERYVARVAQGLSVGILTAALKGASA